MSGQWASLSLNNESFRRFDLCCVDVYRLIHVDHVFLAFVSPSLIAALSVIERFEYYIRCC